MSYFKTSAKVQDTLQVIEKLFINEKKWLILHEDEEIKLIVTQSNSLDLLFLSDDRYKEIYLSSSELFRIQTAGYSGIGNASLLK